MKLYTEEQVRKAALFSLAEDATMEKILDLLTPIELPSDEEIEKKANNWCTVELDEDGFVRLHDYYDLYELPAFIAGAKWMRDKILNR